jgi:hypothetical protein
MAAGSSHQQKQLEQQQQEGEAAEAAWAQVLGTLQLPLMAQPQAVQQQRQEAASQGRLQTALL